MSAQHTSAPWSRNSEDDIHDANGDVVAAVHGPDADEQEANARLIAAAPDLLIQLKGLLGLAKFIISAADIDAEQTTCVLRNRGEAVAEVPIALLLTNAEAAIAKATKA